MNFMISIRKLALKLALRKVAPSSIPLSDGEKILQRDYHSVTLREGENHFLCKSLSGNLVQGYWVPIQAEEPEIQEIPLSRANEMLFYVRQYLRELEFRYSSDISFLLSNFFLLPAIGLWKHRLHKFFFNRKDIARKEQIEILNILKDKRLAGDNNFTTPHQLASDIHSMFLWHHPDRERVIQHYTLWLESLAESGDVEVQERRYRVHPKGLARLAQEEKDDRRHGDAIRTQVVLAFLTACLVGVSLLDFFSSD